MFGSGKGGQRCAGVRSATRLAGVGPALATSHARTVVVRAFRSTDSSITGITRSPARKRHAESRSACSNSGAISIHSIPSACRKLQSEDPGSWRLHASRRVRAHSAYIHSMYQTREGPVGQQRPALDRHAVGVGAPVLGERSGVGARYEPHHGSISLAVEKGAVCREGATAATERSARHRSGCEPVFPLGDGLSCRELPGVARRASFFRRRPSVVGRSGCRR